MKHVVAGPAGRAVWGGTWRGVTCGLYGEPAGVLLGAHVIHSVAQQLTEVGLPGDDGGGGDGGGDGGGYRVGDGSDVDGWW